MNAELDPDLPPQPDSDRGVDGESNMGIPGWVRVFAIAFAIVLVLIGVMVAGGHGPGQHMQP